jgi:glycosyltransferase involved in cell wall biosynthesis
MAKRIYIVNKPLVYYRIGLTNNSQSTNDLYPWDFYKALLGVKQFLQEKKIFSKFKKSYQILAKEICLYNLRNNKKNIYLYEELKREKFKKLGIGPIPTYLISKNFNEKYINHLYFKHVNNVKKKNEVKIIKKSQYSFTPKVSVIIPIYNLENSIINCLDSILNQSLKEIEVICVNDNPNDNTLSKIIKYAENETRIQIISQNNRGLSEAKNIGFKYSNGEFLYFIDGDRYLDKNALSDLYLYAVNNNLDILYFDSDILTNNNLQKDNKLKTINSTIFNFSKTNNYYEILSGKEMFYKMSKKNEFFSATYLQFIKKEFYVKANLSFYPGIVHEDNLFIFTSILLANRTSYIKKSYYIRKIDRKSKVSRNIKYLYGYFIMYSEILKFLEKNKFDGKIKYAIFAKLKKYRKIIADIFNKIPKNEKNIFMRKLTNFQKNQIKDIIKKKKK